MKINKGSIRLVIIISSYLIILWDCKITYSNKKYIYKIKYNGLLWVALDYSSIWMYSSNDKPLTFIEYTYTAKK